MRDPKIAFKLITVFFSVFISMVLSLVILSEFSGTSLYGQEEGELVGVGTFSPMDFPLESRYAGFVEGRKELQVVTEIAGRITKRYFEEGEYVEAGSPLYEIDSHTTAARLEEAQAAADNAKVRLDSAAINLSRYENLVKSGAVSKREYETAFNEKESAQNSYNAALATLESVRSEASLTTVSAPISGYTGVAIKDVGDLAAPGDPSMSLLTTIEDMSTVKVTFYVPEKHVRYYNRIIESYGLTVGEISATLFPNLDDPYEHPGVFEFGQGKVDRLTGTMMSRVSFPNEERELYSGQVVRVVIHVVTIPNVLAIPQSAFLSDPMGLTLFVIKDGVVTPRRVEVRGPYDGFYILTDQSALSPDEPVVLEGLSKVGPGVRPQIAVLPQESYRPKSVMDAVGTDASFGADSEG
jgi:membrane fusion protein (multidrug efflux system)